MIKPEIGPCTKCGVEKEVWPSYKWTCSDCFNEVTKSKFQINGIPLVRVVEDLLMERPIVKLIVERAMMDVGVHHIIRLENDGCIYSAEGTPQWTNSWPKPEPVEPRVGIHAADPDLISKLNKMIDKHLVECDYCKGVIEDESGS